MPSIKNRLTAQLGTFALVAGAVVGGGIAPTAAHAASTVGGPITRSEIIARAQYWVDRGYVYSPNAEQSYTWSPDAAGKTYRNDCSGLVSEAWHINSSLVTGDFQHGGGPSHVLGSSSELLPGDAMVRDGHIELFAYWGTYGNKHGAFVYSFNQPSETVENPYVNSNFGKRGFDPDADVATYTPIRYNNVVEDGAPTSIGAFQANTGFLYLRDTSGAAFNSEYGMMAGTSPAVSGGQAAFQANTGFLYTRDTAGTVVNTEYGMKAGTSPAVAGGEVAFQANTGFLYTRNMATGATANTYEGMMDGTSPAIAGSTSGWKIAFQANNGFLYTLDSSGNLVNTEYGMMAGTSPAITALAGGGYEIAFQANTGFLYVLGSGGAINTQYGMMAGTSPSISTVGSGYTYAFQANTGFLYTRDSSGNVRGAAYGMMKGTSPSIDGNLVAFQANTGFLYLGDVSGPMTNAEYGMQAGTSPAV